MPPEVYEVVAQGARYWFLFLMAVIVWRSYRWLARDRKQRKKRKKLLPDAGFVGEMVIQSAVQELRERGVLSVPWEGIVGAHRGSDLYVPARGVAAKHLWFRYEHGKGLMVRSFMGCQATVDGKKVSRSKDIYMTHGSRLKIGDVELRLRMFAGFETGPNAAATATAMPMAQSPSMAPAATVGPSAGQTITAEQAALWQAQQAALMQQFWLMAQQAAQSSANAANPAAPPAPAEPDTPWALEADEALAWEEWDSPEAPPPPAEENDAHGYVVLTGDEDDLGARPERKRRNLFGRGQKKKAEEAWPYAEYPKSNAMFENQGYTYPEYVGESEIFEDFPAEENAPKSLYVEPDEAERAKHVLWDRYLGGGKKR